MAVASKQAEKQEAKLCTKCGEHERAAQDSNNTWCLECNASYMEVYRARQLDRAHRRGFVAGVAAAHAALAARFAQWPAAQFSGAEISVQIQTTLGPTPPDQTP